MNQYNHINQLKDTYRNDLPEPNPGWPPRVRRVFVLIIVHLFDPQLTVGWMKQRCMITGHNFAARFSYYLGQTPKKYINHHRIETAKILLLQADILVTHVAFEVGYRSVSSFNMAFKNKVGRTPGAYRYDGGS